MSSKTAFVCILLMVSATLSLSAKKDALVSTWHPQAPQIDGDSRDWLGVSLSKHAKYPVDFAFGNDAQGLFILLVFKDPKQFPNDLTGVTVWFNAKGKQKKELGMCFKKKTIPAATMLALLESKNGPLPDEKKQEVLAKPSHTIIGISAINHDEEDQSQEIFKEMVSPEGQFKSTTSGPMTFECRIPMEASNRLGLEAGKTVPIGIEWGGVTKEMEKAMRQKGGYEQSYNSPYPEAPSHDPQESGIRLVNSDRDGIRRPRIPRRSLFWCDVALSRSHHPE